jgi:DNA-binding CsgD family transcriptional regulator
MTCTRAQAQKGAAITNAKHAGRIARRRAQVFILRLCRPGMSAEDVARELKCSPSTIRGDWRALKLTTRE